MDLKTTYIDGVYIIEQTKYLDERGMFMESFNQKLFTEKIGEFNFVQDNYSLSKKNVLRGLHLQVKHPQGKLIYCSIGSIYDVIVDLRKDSKSFCKWFGITLDRPEIKLWIPPGFAHGFISLEDNTHVHYKTTDYYSPKHEKTLLWNDTNLKIDWPITNNILISNKDREGYKLIDLVKENI